jgi:hypothetical protein
MEKTICWNIDTEEMIDIHMAGIGAVNLKRPWSILFTLLLEIAVIVISISFITAPGTGTVNVLIGIFMPLLIPFSFGYQFLYLPWKIRSYYRDQKNAIGEYRFTFTDEQLIIRAPGGETATPWTAFRSWKDTGIYLFLFQGTGLVNFLRKSLLDDELLKFIQGKIEANRKQAPAAQVSKVIPVFFAVFLTVGVVSFILWYFITTYLP